MTTIQISVREPSEMGHSKLHGARLGWEIDVDSMISESMIRFNRAGLGMISSQTSSS
jgi:hypothetical protein